MSDSFDITGAPEITEWLNKHQTLSHLFSFKQCEAGTPGKVAKQRSIENHISQFSAFLTMIQREKEETMELLTKASQEKLRKLGNLSYDDMRNVTLARRITFCYHELQRLNVEYQSMKADLLLKCEEDAECALKFVTSEAIPEECICVVDKEFFLLELPSRLSKLGFKREAMGAYVERLEKQLAKAPTAPWASDLAEYVSEAILDNERLFNSELYYIPPLACEVAISRAIFGGCYPGIAEKIDHMLEDEELFKRSELVEMLCDIVPKLPGESEAGEAVRLLMFFRIVFDRFYEKADGKLMDVEVNDLEAIARIMRLECKDIFMPEKISPPCESGETLIRELYRNNSVFLPAIQFFEQLEFLVNPVDMIFSVHKCLTAINKAALLTKAHGHELTKSELTNMLSFDELFALLIGVAVGADVPELFNISNFLSCYTPRFCLSNSFEYAEAGIESLALHFKDMKLNVS